jgi:hypothetical protein
MNANLEFRVHFGPIARTLVYQDRLGTICFAFDISPANDGSKTGWRLHLGQQPLTEHGNKMECETEAEQQRIALALERTKQYVSARGYRVNLS